MEEGKREASGKQDGRHKCKDTDGGKWARGTCHAAVIDREAHSAKVSIWKVENLFFNVCPALQHEPQTTVNGYVEVGGYIPTVADPHF